MTRDSSITIAAASMVRALVSEPRRQAAKPAMPAPTTTTSATIAIRFFWFFSIQPCAPVSAMASSLSFR